MKHIIFMWLSLFLAGAVYAGLEDDDEIGVSFISSPEEVNPGSYETYVIEIENYLTETVELTSNIEMPEGWSIISGPASYSIPGLKKQKAVFLIMISDDCRSGGKKLKFEFRDDEKDFIKTAEIFPFVNERPSLSLQVIEEVSLVSEGDELTFSYLIVNEGNTVEEIKVSSEKGNVSGEKNFSLEPGNSKRVTVKSKAKLRKGTTQMVRKFFDVNVQSSSLPDPIRKTSLVKVIPNQTEKFDPFLRFPVVASAYYVVGRTANRLDDAFQLELAGNGYLDFEQEKQLNFLFRGPNQFQVTRLGNFDQYSLQYRQSDFEVQLGDGNYQVSQLLEQGRLARGASGKVIQNNVELSVSHAIPRFNPDIEYITSSTLMGKVSKHWSLGATAMQKQFSETGIAYLGSFHTRYESRFFMINTELSASRWQTEDWGGSIQMSARYDNFSLNGMALYSGPEYAGFFNNSLILTGNVSYRIEDLSFGAGVNYNESNPALDTFQIAAPFARNYFVNTTYNVNERSQIWLFAVQRSREDRFEPKRFHYDERSLRFRYTYKSPTFTNQTNLMLGQTQNLLLESSSNETTTYSINSNVGIIFSPRFNMNLFGTYLRTNRYSAELDEIFLYGGGLNYNTPLIRFGVNYRNNYLLDEINFDRSILNTSLAIRLGNHELGGFIGYNIFRNTIDERDFFATATYRYRINVPIAKRKDIGSLSGQIIRSDGKYAEGVVLKVGRITAVTDEKGFFEFENLKKGGHYLIADINTIGLKETFVQDMPFYFEIGPSEDKSLGFNLITAASVTMPVKYQLGPRVNAPSGLVVRLTREDQVLLTDLSPQGAFEFLKLNPGVWDYEIVENGWERKYSIRPSSGTFKLKEGDKVELPIIVKEKELQIKFKN